MAVNINDVAKKAQVSNSTVSKVLNNSGSISEATKQRVLNAAKELNFIPNSSASSLSSKNKNKIAAYIYINNQRQAIDEINMQYLFGAFNRAKELNVELITIFNTTVQDFSKLELVGYLNSLNIRQLVIFGLNKEDAIMHEIIGDQLFQIVVVDAPIVNEMTSSVSVDHLKGQYEVAKLMMANIPVKKVLYLAGRKDGYVTDSRLAGITRLQNERNFELNIMYADFSEKKAYDLAYLYGSDHDSIVCASDLMAIGAMNALIAMNIFRPVCGFDGITLMGYAGKQMYTCRQDFYRVAEVAMNEINRLINNKKGRSILLDFEIVRIKYEDVIF